MYRGFEQIDGEQGIVRLKDAIYNLNLDAGPSHEYAKGVLLGLVSGLMGCGITFEQATQLMWQIMPNNVPPERIPSSWHDIFKDRIKK